jgi:hypothetical protein
MYELAGVSLTFITSSPTITPLSRERKLKDFIASFLEKKSEQKAVSPRKTKNYTPSPIDGTGGIANSGYICPPMKNLGYICPPMKNLRSIVLTCVAIVKR